MFSDCIKVYKIVLVYIVKLLVCIECVQYYIEMYQQYLDKLILVCCVLVLVYYLVECIIWIKYDELIVGNQVSEVCVVLIFLEYIVLWIEKEIDDLVDWFGVGFFVSEENKCILYDVCLWWCG